MSTQALSTVGDRGLQVNSLEDLLRFAKMVLSSGLAPSSFKTDAQVLVAVQTGMELGFPPMTSLNAIAVFNGKPAIYGKAATALVLRSGQLEAISEKVEGTGDQRCAIVRLRRLGVKGWFEGRFSVTDAMHAQVHSKRGYNGPLWGKPGPWKNHPEDMLLWRARHRAYQAGFADMLCGLNFVEVQRDIPAEPEEVPYTEAGGNDIESLLPPVEAPQEPQEAEIEQPEPDDAPEDETPDERAERQLDEDLDWLGGE